MERIELTSGGTSGTVTVPDEPSGWGVVCLPGASHGPYGDVFDELAAAVTDAGGRMLRYEGWDGVPDIQHRTLEELGTEIETAVEQLTARGCASVAVVAKSAGGGIALTAAPDAPDRHVLWAPAVRLAAESNVEQIRHTELGETDGARLGPERLAEIDHPVCVIQGTDDDLAANSRRLVERLPNAELVEIEGLDHSFTGEPFEARILDATLDRLPTDGVAENG